MDMKTLKFRAHLVPLVLSGEKTVTWRLFDDKDLQEGDVVNLINWETKQVFARAIVLQVRTKKLGDLTEVDYVGHEKFANIDDMLAHYREYYGDRVNGETGVKIINFKLL